MPAITMPWPEAGWFGYDEVLAAKDLDYRGRPFKWVTMPDQFTLLRSARSSSAPASRDAADGADFQPRPLDADPDDGAVGDDRRRPRVRRAGDKRRRARGAVARPAASAARTRLSIDYAMEAVGAFVDRFARVAVVIVVGDHQPAELVTGPRRDARRAAAHPHRRPAHSRSPRRLGPRARHGAGAGRAGPADAGLPGAFRACHERRGPRLMSLSTCPKRSGRRFWRCATEGQGISLMPMTPPGRSTSRWRADEAAASCWRRSEEPRRPRRHGGRGRRADLGTGRFALLHRLRALSDAVLVGAAAWWGRRSAPHGARGLGDRRRCGC